MTKERKAKPTGFKYYNRQYGTFVEYEYRGKKYEVEYSNCWNYGNGGNPAAQHREAQERIDREIEEANKPKKPVRYEGTAEYGFELFWESVTGESEE